MGDSGRETHDRDESTAGNEQSATNTGRRTLLRALGGASALAALGGAGAGSAGASEAGAEAAQADATDYTEIRERARRQGEIDPVWGFPALSEDTDPPTSARHEVELQIRPRDAPVPEFVFEPTGLYVEQGDTVRFSYESPHHTVTAYHPGFGYVQRVPNEVPPFSGPSLPEGGYWLYTFDRSGVYDIHCAPHEIFGHAMRIVVGSPSGPGADPLPDLCAGQEQTATPTETAVTTVPEDGEGAEEASLPRLGAYTVLSDPALNPDAIVDNRRVSWDDLAPESKQPFVEFRGFPPC